MPTLGGVEVFVAAADSMAAASRARTLGPSIVVEEFIAIQLLGATSGEMPFIGMCEGTSFAGMSEEIW